ncbi:MAG: transcription-repair coupling factor [Bacteroidota bacterium]|nr:transcription-repair coupling factor [Bacteroidota bacterium]
MQDGLIRVEDFLSRDPKATELASLLNERPKQRILVQGLSGSRDSFLLFASFQKIRKPILIIADNKEEAAYLLDDLIQYSSKPLASLFPDSFRKPLLFEELDLFQVQQRMEALHKIGQPEPQILVTYPEALFEKMVSDRALTLAKIDFKSGEKLDIDEVIHRLVHYGFERVDFVFEPGQFSIRGGIFDVFSFVSDFPYRIELNDDIIESIRSFDTISQLSLLNIGRFSIIPNINSDYKNEEKQNIFDILPEQTILWIKDLEDIKDRLQKCFEEAERFGEKMVHYEEERNVKMIRERAFVYPHEIMDAIQRFSIVFFATKPVIQEELNILQVHSKPQPNFNKNFTLLIEDLKQLHEKKYYPFICTNSKAQIERFYNIFEDLKADTYFHPELKSLREGFIDEDLKIAVYTDHQIFSRFHGYKAKNNFTRDQAISLKLLKELQTGDYVTHIDHGIGRFAGLEKITVNEQTQEVVRLIYRNDDILYVSIHSLHKIAKYTGKEGTVPHMNKLGSDQWKIIKQRTKQKVKDIAKELIKLYASRKTAKGFAFSPDNYLQAELEASFIYEDTPDQYKATQDVKADMEKPYPMDRLVCGDVGFGKTEVAIRAAFKAIQDGKQVAILVPTTILALQHYRTFSERFKPFSIDLDYLSRFRTAKEKTVILKKLKEGKIELIIGTHSLLSQKTEFKDLGLLIIDEEQKFGVAAKERLRQFKVNVDTLTLTATPIPRTLQFSLMAARDLSSINTPPPNRQPIYTERRVFNDELIKDAIHHEVFRGGQVFFVFNRVKGLEEVAQMIRKLCPSVDVAVAHGKLEAEKLETVLVDFIDHKYDVLVSTNIIETGLDIPNANTIIIHQAHQFGLSDLHQLRGRVGRSNRKAYCYLFAPPSSVLTPEAKKRLKTIEEFSDLGSGFNVAMRDLDIRGAGNLLGGEQSGFIVDIGYDTYQKILEEAIFELKENEFKEVFQNQDAAPKIYVRDVSIDSDIEMLFPDGYISNIQERLLLYQKLDKIKNEEGISQFSLELKDRFGTIPPTVENLFHGLRLRWVARDIGFERVVLKKKKLQCFFITNPSSTFFESSYFKELLKAIADPFWAVSLKQSNQALIMIKEQVKDMKVAKDFLLKFHAAVVKNNT